MIPLNKKVIYVRTETKQFLAKTITGKYCPWSGRDSQQIIFLTCAANVTCDEKHLLEKIHRINTGGHIKDQKV